jgi:hypothetical protein
VTDQSAGDQRGPGGRFAPGNKLSPGRPRKRPLRDVCSFDEESRLWALHVELAQTDTSAREFILRHVAGNPYQAAPEIPPLEWPRIASVSDLTGMVNAILGAQASGDLDAAGMGFLVDLTIKLSKVFEVVELAPKINALQARMDEMRAAGALEPGR